MLEITIFNLSFFVEGGNNCLMDSNGSPKLSQSVLQLTTMLNRDAIHVHDESVLLIMDMSVGVELGRLRQRIESLMTAAQNLLEGLDQFDPENNLTTYSQPSLRSNACQKCLLQHGEDRQAI